MTTRHVRVITHDEITLVEEQLKTTVAELAAVDVAHAQDTERLRARHARADAADRELAELRARRSELLRLIADDDPTAAAQLDDVNSAIDRQAQRARDLREAAQIPTPEHDAIAARRAALARAMAVHRARLAILRHRHAADLVALACQTLRPAIDDFLNTGAALHRLEPVTDVLPQLEHGPEGRLVLFLAELIKPLLPSGARWIPVSERSADLLAGVPVVEVDIDAPHDEAPATA